MKKSIIIKAMAAAVALVGFAACSDDEGTEISNNNVKVVTSPTMFEWNGGETEMTVDKTITSAYADADWLTVSNSGEKVTLTATSNTSRESRHAELVVKASATDSVIVSVSQLGLVFNAEEASDISITDKDTTVVLPVTTNGDVVVSECPDWITATMTDDGLSLAISANTTGSMRGGDVVFGIGDMTKQVSVLQFDIDRDLFGSYYIAHYNGDEADFALPVTFTRDGGIDFTPTGIFARSIPGTFDDSALTFTFYNGNLLGKYSSYFIYNMLVSSDGYLAFDTSIVGTFTFAYDADLGTFVGTIGGSFDGSGSRTTATMYLWAFSSMELSSSYSKGYIAQVDKLIKANSSEEALRVARMLKGEFHTPMLIGKQLKK